MTGKYPTVGLMAFMDKLPVSVARKRIVQALQHLIPWDSWYKSDIGQTFALASIGYGHLQVILITQKTFHIPSASFVSVDFDEGEVVGLVRSTGLTIAELLSPYIAAMHTVTGCKAIGVGFEVSSPEVPWTPDVEAQILTGSGISLLFIRKPDNITWLRQELLPLIGDDYLLDAVESPRGP